MGEELQGGRDVEGGKNDQRDQGNQRSFAYEVREAFCTKTNGETYFAPYDTGGQGNDSKDSQTRGEDKIAP